LIPEVQGSGLMRSSRAPAKPKAINSLVVTEGASVGSDSGLQRSRAGGEADQHKCVLLLLELVGQSDSSQPHVSGMKIHENSKKSL